MATNYVDFKNFLLKENLVLSVSPGDGHCLLYSIITCYRYQLNFQLDLNKLISLIFIETVSKAEYYEQFLSSEDKLLLSLNKYIIDKNYNTSFGDLLPLIIANTFTIHLKIINQEHSTAHIINISPTSGAASSTIILHRQGDHYNGLVPKHKHHIINTPKTPDHLFSVSGVIHRQLARPVVTHPDIKNITDIRSTPVDVSLFSPKDGGVIHRQLTRPVVTRPNKNITYTSKDLHALRPVSTKIPRETRKIIFSCGIWKPGATKTPNYESGCKISAIKRLSNQNNLIKVKLIPHRQIKTPNEKVSLLLLNAQSIKNKELEIRDAIFELKADLAIVTETWLKDSDNVWVECCELNKDGLKMDVVNRSERPGGGIAIIHKRNIKVKTSKAGNARSFEYAVWKVQFKDITVTILAIYRPPYSDVNRVTVNMFLEDFSKFLPDFITDEQNVIIMGDFNIHINDETDRNAQAFKELIDGLGLEQHVTSATHKAGNILDHLYTEVGGNIKIIQCVNKDYISDHCIIQTTLGIPKDHIKQSTVTYRKFSSIDKTVFQNDLQFDYSDINNVNELIAKFEERTRDVIDKHAPEKTKTVMVRPRNIWYTPEVKHQKQEVRKKERRWKKKKTNCNWNILKEEKRKYRNLLKHTKKEILNSQVIEAKGNTKRLYQLFNNMTGKSIHNPFPENISDQNMAEKFADYFLNKIQCIREALSHVPTYSSGTQVDCRLSKFLPLTSDQVRKIIFSLSTKSCELDAMPTKLLKDIIPGVLPVINKIVNLSLEQGVFAENWKTSVIRPLLKKQGLDLTTSNYRPVSNLPFLSKVLEKAALQQFMAHSDYNHLMPDYQSAYRKHFSCETALVKLMDDLLWSMEKQQATALMAMDLSAAFDTVDHDVLLTVLSSNFGIEGDALNWFDSYLRPRQCKVNVGASYSNIRELSFSVPQGSCAGPVLYLVYASTMQEAVPSDIQIHGYADDHALKISFNAKDRAEESKSIDCLQQSAISVKDWMDKNRLKMNSSKTEFIIFGSQKQLDKCVTTSLDVCGDTVQLSNEIKYLGVHMDKHLTLKHHIQLKCRTAMWNLQRIKLVRDILTKDACETLVLGTVMAHLDYANALYIGLPKCDIMKFQRIQNIAAKLVLRSKDNSISCLKKLHWLPVNLRIKHKVMTLLYKALNGESPGYLRDLVVLQTTHRPGLRSEDKHQRLAVPITRRKTFASRAFSVAAPQWWNELPNSVKMSPNADTFKKRLKTYLFDQF